jgi:ABC-type transport system involved in cytochrome c biogenesis permease component
VNGILTHIAIGLRLYFRNRMALLYGYLFPTVFLVSFAVLYRHEDVPLVRHAGELLTITVLGGACFGLPTTLVSERERGVWRRLRLVPVPAGTLVAATLVARYVILISAVLLQLALAMAIGMPAPAHPGSLWVSFTCVAFAFLGIGLVLAMMADSVPAVQALGQCIFLPMLVIGGVAVPLASLPEWAQQASAFLPGRYAVDALQASVSGAGFESARRDIPALIVIGLSACIAAAGMFRWDPQQRFATMRGKPWLGIAAAAWIAVGLWGRPQAAIVEAPAPPQEAERMAPERERPAADLPVADAPAASVRRPPSSWRGVTRDDIDREIPFNSLPPDSGVVAPIAGVDEPPDTHVIRQLVRLRRGLAEWPPAKVADPVQRVRNYLYVAAVPDVFQIPLERHAPLLVFARLREEFPKDDLVQLLYWVARHPSDGDAAAVGQMHALGLGSGPSDIEQIRERVSFYALKLLGRLTGKIPDA